jgi:hypothetical protein
LRPTACQARGNVREVWTTWEFCKLLDRKFIASKKGFDEWLRLAKTHEWIKTNE